MCSKPKIPDPPPPPAPPPPPMETAEKVATKKRSPQKTKRKGTSALTVRRTSSVNTGSSGSGANMNY